ncbi:MAG: SPOR domain-containing protein [Phycisphaerales bacterium]|nr:SPOR domain-containing protein [Phycisphaerales bacterium]
MPQTTAIDSFKAIRYFFLGALAVASLGLTACQTSGSSRQSQTLDTAITAYDRNDFRQAQIYADLARKGPDSEQRHTAAYVAGLAAWNLDEESDARILFLDAKNGSDRATNGGAHAMLGQIALGDSRYKQAAAHFDIAAQALKEPDASKSRRWANTARRLAGVSDTVATGEWAIQFGAFASETRARRAQNSLVKNPRVIKLGRVNVISSKQGDGLYLVQMGLYEDRKMANIDRDKLASLGCIVVPSGSR